MAGQAGGVPVMDNKLWQFENAKAASKYDSISPYFRNSEASVVYWLSNKVAPGYALGFDKEEFTAYKESFGRYLHNFRQRIPNQTRFK